jgi:heptosyltransferase-1
MQGLIKSAIISKLLPSKQIIGFDKLSIREKFASNFYNKKLNCPYEKNVIERNLTIIAFALGTNFKKKELKNKTSFLYSTSKKLSIKLSESKKNILIIPGASHDSKRYPSAKLAEFTQLFDAAFYVIWGTEEEKILAGEIKEISPFVNLCSKLNLDSLIFLISKVDLVIGPDSGPTHIAWALNVPSITLFGPTPGYRNAIGSSVNRVIESNTKVNPLKIDKNDYSIESISVQEIISAAKELLD